VRASKRATTHTGCVVPTATIVQHLAKVGVCYSTILELNATPSSPDSPKQSAGVGPGVCGFFLFFFAPGRPFQNLQYLHSKSGDFITRARRRISGV
jgi:hypothetical protein